MVEETGIHFAEVSGAKVAYDVHEGRGHRDVVYCPGFASHLDLTMEQPRYRAFAEALCSYGRLIRFDRRGAGISDGAPSDRGEGWELWADDLSAVLDAVGSRRAVIVATNDAGAAGMLYAATHPERTEALILFNTTARFVGAPDYPVGHPVGVAELVTDAIRTTWGTEESMPYLAPSLVADAAFSRWYARFQRAACTPAEMAESLHRLFQLDARAVLPEVRCPTLVLHRADYATVPLEQGKHLADHIDGAVLEVLPGADAPIYTDSADLALEAIGRFLGPAKAPLPDPRRFGTVLFTDIVGSTDRAFAMGDETWSRILEAHDAVAREVIGAEGGRLIKTTGDGVLAMFASPSPAIRVARTLSRRAPELGIQIRAGLHAGQVVLRTDGDIAGTAVHVAARVLGAAEGGEVLVTRPVLDLLGDDVPAVDRGFHRFKGVPDPVEVCALA